MDIAFFYIHVPFKTSVKPSYYLPVQRSILEKVIFFWTEPKQAWVIIQTRVRPVNTQHAFYRYQQCSHDSLRKPWDADVTSCAAPSRGVQVQRPREAASNHRLCLRGCGLHHRHHGLHHHLPQVRWCSENSKTWASILFMMRCDSWRYSSVGRDP